MMLISGNLTAIIIYAFLGMSLLRRGRERILNQVIALFFFTSTFGLVITIIYRLLETEGYIIYFIPGNRISMFFNTLSVVYFLIFNEIILYGESIVTRKRMTIEIIIWVTACSPILWLDGVNYIAGDAVYSLFYGFYGLGLSITYYIVIIRITIQNARKFEDRILIRKYWFTSIGVLLMLWVVLITFVANMINTTVIRSVLAISAMILLPGSILIYLGTRSGDIKK
jgi:hypothetical protein